MTKTTPMMRQYLDAKAAHPDCILLFRMGDFYEVFFDDAVTASRELDLTLTARGKDQGEPIPMAGVPHHAAVGYIRRLVAKGFHVAICDQLEDPSRAKGIVRRGVTRVITPGVVLDEDSLDAKSNNYLVSLAASTARDSDVTALGCVDISTGELRVCELQATDAVLTELRRIGPAEIVVAEGQTAGLEVFSTSVDALLTVRDDRSASLERVVKAAEGTLLARREIGQVAATLSTSDLRERLAELDAHHLRDRAAVDAALALLLDYLMATQGGIPRHVGAPTVYRSEDFVVLDPASAANLEIFETLMGGKRRGSLFAVIDETVSAAGARRLRTWLSYPLIDVPTIRRRQGAVTTLVDHLAVRESLREELGRASDIQRLCSRLTAGQGNARDLVTLRTTLAVVPTLRDLLDPLEDDLVAELRAGLDPCDDLGAAIGAAIIDEPPIALTEGGLIRRGYNADLDELIALTTDSKQWLLEFEAAERQSTGVQSLKVKHNKVFGYYIEVTRANLEAVPDHYIRKQTLANAERFFTPELKEREEEILTAAERRAALEYRIFEEVRALVLAELARLRGTAERLADLDALAALAHLSARRDYCAPEVTEEAGIEITAGRHPVVETMLAAERFVPNDIVLDDQSRLLIITGPNMAGKSTVIRQVALIALLAQIGSHVPARRARVGVVDQIFSRVGASDNLARGQSTFMVEMTEAAHILANATDRSLVVLDEIGRGTATYDGLSIAWAVAEFLHDELGAFTLFATHYHEVTTLARVKERVRNFNIAAKEWNEEIIFLHKLVEGPANRSYGIQVARLAGVPEPVVKRAREVLANLESQDYTDEDPTIAREYDGGVPVVRKSPQLLLFGDRSPPTSEPGPPRILREIATMPVDTLSPLEALNLLYGLQKRARKLVRDSD